MQDYQSYLSGISTLPKETASIIEARISGVCIQNAWFEGAQPESPPPSGIIHFAR